MNQEFYTIFFTTFFFAVCGQSLGIGKGTLGETISTSSSGACSPETYKLHGNNTFSFSNVFSTTERIIEGTLEITLPEEYSITGIVTQGALLLDNSEASTWATKYRLLYSRGVGDGNDFRDRPYVSISGAQKVRRTIRYCVISESSNIHAIVAI